MNSESGGKKSPDKHGFLVITRRIDESILLGDSIVITVTRIKGKQVTIGIQAPKELKIHRKECLDADNAKKEGI